MPGIGPVTVGSEPLVTSTADDVTPTEHMLLYKYLIPTLYGITALYLINVASGRQSNTVLAVASG